MSLEWQSGWEGPLIEDGVEVLDVLELGPRVTDWLLDENDPFSDELAREISVWVRAA